MLKLEHLGIQSFTRLVVLTAGLFSLGVSCRAVDSPESTSAELRSCESGETTATCCHRFRHTIGRLQCERQAAAGRGPCAVHPGKPDAGTPDANSRDGGGEDGGAQGGGAPDGGVRIDGSSAGQGGGGQGGQGGAPPDAGATDAGPIDASVNQCPVAGAIKVVVDPGKSPPTGSRTLSVVATDANGDKLSFVWSSPAGSLVVAPWLSTARYSCQSLGPQIVTVVVSDGQCASTASIAFDCLDLCDNLVLNPGEDCEVVGSAISGRGGLLCPPGCKILCGNGIIDAQSGEACDPPDGQSCDTNCQRIPGTAEPGVCNACLNNICGGSGACAGLSGVDATNCQALYGCMKSNLGACVVNSSGSGDLCYCGNSPDCATSPNGGCKEQLEAVAQTNIPSEVLSQLATNPLILNLKAMVLCYGTTCAYSCRGVAN